MVISIRRNINNNKRESVLINDGITNRGALRADITTIDTTYNILAAYAVGHTETKGTRKKQRKHQEPKANRSRNKKSKNRKSSKCWEYIGGIEGTENRDRDNNRITKRHSINHKFINS